MMRQPFVCLMHFVFCLRHGAVVLVAGLLSACNLAPVYQRPDMPVPATVDGATPNVPAGFEVATATAPAPSWYMQPWQQWVQSAPLRSLVERALQNNRDMRVALANIEKARAQYGVQRSDQWPAINASGQGTRSRMAEDVRSGASAATSNQFSVQLGMANYEFDFWGRVRNLGEAALLQYLQVEENHRSVQLSLIADVVNAWVALDADQQRLQLARETLATREDAYTRMQRMHQLGAASALVLAQSQTVRETARADVAAYEAQVQRDRNTLQLLAGLPIAGDMLPVPTGTLSAQTFSDATSGKLTDPSVQPVNAFANMPSTAMTVVPAGLPSEVLLVRPDIVAAERGLQAQYANIGAARAAFFPTISLTANAGTASNELSGLFGAGNHAWSFVPQIRLPIFDAGRNQANLDIAQANREVALAQYEKTIQTAFREVSDALADQATMQRRLQAQAAMVQAASRVLVLSQARFKAGADDFLTVLDAQRSLYAAQQTQISLLQAEQVNRIALYKALGGGVQAQD